MFFEPLSHTLTQAVDIAAAKSDTYEREVASPRSIKQHN